MVLLPQFIHLDLYNYFEFMEKILYKIFRIMIKQHVFVVEMRHILGMILDDDGLPIPLQ